MKGAQGFKFPQNTLASSERLLKRQARLLPALQRVLTIERSIFIRHTTGRSFDGFPRVRMRNLEGLRATARREQVSTETDIFVPPEYFFEVRAIRRVTQHRGDQAPRAVAPRGL